jgi:hypothetical protein
MGAPDTLSHIARERPNDAAFKNTPKNAQKTRKTGRLSTTVRCFTLPTTVPATCVGRSATTKSHNLEAFENKGISSGRNMVLRSPRLPLMVFLGPNQRPAEYRERRLSRREAEKRWWQNFGNRFNDLRLRGLPSPRVAFLASEGQGSGLADTLQREK